MPSFQILVSDAALREALIEQLRSLKSGETTELSAITHPVKDDDIFILDKEALDKKTLKILRDIHKDRQHILIFLIGDAEVADVELFTETFRKPLRLGHLLARLRLHSDTASRLRNIPLVFGPYRLEAHNRQIIVSPQNDVIRLTEKETALLEYLGQSDHPVGRDELLAAIWGYDNTIETHTLETHIYQLRRKLDPGNTGENWLLNEQGAYRLNRASNR